MRASILVDQLGSPAGGGRFIRGFLRTLLSDPGLLDEFERIHLVATQGERVEILGPLPPQVSVVERRFPQRLRGTPAAALFGYTLPAVDVAWGPFFYVFPGRARARVTTVHDLSIFHAEFHPEEATRKTGSQTARTARTSDGIVCISDATLDELRSRWPELAPRSVRIYNGLSADDLPRAKPQPGRKRSILVVGTIEPRKNYPTILDAYDRLRRERGSDAPGLVVIGGSGWMSEAVERRLEALTASGACRWMRNASDDALADAYASTSVFSYLSLFEGFGYPPFEAAFARCPMVLSNMSAVGEIWSGHARCVDPSNVSEIIDGWSWALALDGAEHAAVVDAQDRRAREFTWHRAVKDYIAFWKRLIRGDR